MIKFEEGTSTPGNWFRQADQMLKASEVLNEAMLNIKNPKREMDIHRKTGMMKGAMLLLGLAAENALKGAICHNLPPDISSGNLKSKHFQDNGQSHDLLEIAKKSGVTITPKRKYTLERLTIFVQWAAKYQAPLRKVDHEKAEGMLRFYPSVDYRVVESLITDLHRMVGYEDHIGWSEHR